MNKNPGKTPKLLGNFVQAGERRDLPSFFVADREVSPKTVVEKVVLLPKIKRGVELRGKMTAKADRIRRRNAMQFRDLLEGRMIEWPSRGPRLVAMTPEVVFTQIFNPDQTFVWIMKMNLRGA